MLRKLSVALLIAASPAMAQDAAPTETVDAAAAEAPAVAYKTKKVCRSVEVVGSSIPRTTCRIKKIPIKPAEEAADTRVESAPQSGSQQ